MNFLQLCQRTREKCGISGVGPLSVMGQAGENLRIVNWVNEAWVDIQNERKDWMWMRRDFSFNTTIGQQAYTPTQAGAVDLSHWRTDTLRVYRTAVGVNDEQHLRFYEYESFRDIYQYANRIPGRPNFFAVRPQDYALLLGPIPDTFQFTVTGQYQKRATELVGNNDIPDFPEQFHMLIVYEAMQRYAAYEAAPEVVAGISRNYDKMRTALQNQQLEQVFIPETLA